MESLYLNALDTHKTAKRPVGAHERIACRTDRVIE